jgi:hypothetical protein
MLDRVGIHCHRCGKWFETWLLRGEICPALCLGCWFHTPAGAGEAVSQSKEADTPPFDADVIDPNEPDDPAIEINGGL